MITQRLGKLPKLLGITQTEFEREVGMSGGVLRKALNKNTHVSSKWVEIISEKFPVNAHWLATGEGKPLLTQISEEYRVDEAVDEYKTKAALDLEKLPLIPQDILANFDKDHNISKFPTYYLPDFSTKKGNFIVRLNEDSMLPRYKGGSLFICKFIEDKSVIQWGKTFVLCTNSGTMLRRLLPSNKGVEYVTCGADNNSYPSFELKLEDITKIHMVVGVISFE